jgi:hypothetical protein
MRPRSHILETESRKAFDQVIPSEWVVRPQDSDYGLDVQVQIFENGRITPFFFYAQLKATDAVTAGDDAPSWPFSTSRLLHYFESSFPVMLVLFEVSGKRLFYEWAHDLYMQLSRQEMRKLHAQETFTVKFHRVLNTKDITNIGKEVRNQFFRIGYQPRGQDSITIVVSLDIPDQDTQISKAIARWLNEDPSTQFVKTTESDGEHDGTIRIHHDSSGQNTPLISVSCLNKELLYTLNDTDVISRDELFSDLILAIALVLSAAGRFNSALDMLGRFFSEERPLTFFATTLLTDASVAEMYAGAKRSAEAMGIAESLLKRGYLEPATVMSTAVLLTDNRNFYLQQHRRFLKAALDSDAGNDKGAP